MWSRSSTRSPSAPVTATPCDAIPSEQRLTSDARRPSGSSAGRIAGLLGNRGTLRAAAGTSLSNVLIILGATVAGAISARELGPTGRGDLAALFVWAAVLQTAAMFGLPNAFSFMVAKYPAERAPACFYLLRLLPLQALVATAVYVVAMVIVFRSRLDVASVLCFVVWIPASMLSTLVTNYAHGAGNFRAFNALRLVPALGTGLGLVTVGTASDMTLRTASGAYLAAALANVPLCLLLLRGIRRGDVGGTFTRSGELWSYARRNVTAVLSVTANARVDQLVLSVLAPASTLGLYAVAATASTAIVPVVTGVAMVGFNRIASSSDEHLQASIVRRLLTFVTLLATAGTVAFVVSASWIIPTVFGEGFSGAVPASRALALGAVFVAWNLVLADALRACDHPGVVGLSELAGAAVTAGGLVIVSDLSLVWIALASVLGYLASSVVSGWVVVKVLPVMGGSRRPSAESREG